MLRAPLRAALSAATGLAAFGCAANQRLSLECVPKDVMVYVDGRLVTGAPKTVKLAVDEPHTIFVKGGGYQSQMVVFESQAKEAKPVSDPVELCSRVNFVELQPEVKIELDPGAAPAP